eukprot:COSAG01_NODE_8330_length_2826_cov_17.633297_3_plen_250_part_00
MAALPVCVASPHSCRYSAVVLAGARGVTLRGNEVNGAGALVLGPPADKSVPWLAEDVAFGSNARFAPDVHLLPLNNTGRQTADMRAREVGCTGCKALGYASFESPDVLHRNYGWPLNQGAPYGPNHRVCEGASSFDGRWSCIWHAKQGDLALNLAGSMTMEQTPTLAGHAVYAAIRVKPLQNGTELVLELGDVRGRCNTVADLWTRCVVAAELGESGVATVTVHAASPGGWTLSDLVLARVGASLNLLG